MGNEIGLPNDANGDSSNINFELNQGVLSRLEGLDPGVAGIRISETNWVDGAGQAIAHSTCLKRLCLWIRHRESYDFMIRQLCNEWLPRNRSIETFSILDGPSPSGGGTISFSFLTPFFENNDNLRCIQLSNIVHMKPWDIEPIVRALSACKKDQLERIDLHGVRGTDEERAQFFSLLTSTQQGLLELHVSHFFDDQRGAPTKMAYDALTTFLENPASKLQTLRIDKNDVLDIISKALINNESLTSLDLSFGGYMYNPEFFRLVDVLHSCSLQRLTLRGNHINDEGVSYLGRALVNNKTTLKYLNLCESDGITTGGWREFSNCLKSPNCLLEELNIRHCYIDDDSASVIVSALTGNSYLKQLYMLSDTGGIEFTGTIWKVLFRVLCDTSSIDSIAFSSNHTIHTIDICSEEEGAPDLIVSLLEMNNNESNAESARRKILEYAFFDGKFILELARLPNNVLPFGLGWVGRDRFGYSTMYNVMRRLSRDLVVESESGCDMDHETMDD